MCEKNVDRQAIERHGVVKSAGYFVKRPGLSKLGKLSEGLSYICKRGIPPPITQDCYED